MFSLGFIQSTFNIYKHQLIWGTIFLTRKIINNNTYIFFWYDLLTEMTSLTEISK